jgi:hypothetical protein
VAIKEPRDAIPLSPYFVGNNRAVIAKITGDDPVNLLRVYLAILGHVNKKTGLAYPSQERLAELLACSTKTVSRMAHELQRRGMIVITHRPIAGTNKYQNIYRPIYDTEGLDEADVRSIASLTGHNTVRLENPPPIRQLGVHNGHHHPKLEISNRTPSCPVANRTASVSDELLNIKDLPDKLETAEAVIHCWLMCAWKHGKEEHTANEDDLATAHALVAKGITANQLEHAILPMTECPRLAPVVRDLLP